MTRSIGLSAGILTALFLASTATADMGRVTYSTDKATVGETAQKAIILNNGREEVLILGTQLHASKRTPIIRFIPFPSEPTVSLAPKDVFGRLQEVVAKYDLQYVYAFHSKGGPEAPRMQGVEVRLAAKLGAHDITVVKVTDVAAFRAWVNGYFKKHHLPQRASYPGVEAVVADYVRRGIAYFALDSVEVGIDSSFVAPLAYRFKSASLYYPLKTSNTFGGKGEIELFVIAPKTLCVPGSNLWGNDPDKTAGPNGNALEQPCLGLAAKASTSAELVPAEHDLQTIYPAAEGFFGTSPVFLQTIRYVGPYEFKDDVQVDLTQGVARALGVEQPGDWGDDPFHPLTGEDRPICHKKPDRGPCKGLFDAYYFDPASHSCKAFIWGGCQGSVPFQTLEECRKACIAAPPK